MACGLTLATAHAARVWTSESTLWTRAHQIAPVAPRPLIGLAWVAFRAGDDSTALRELDFAACAADRQPPIEADWVRDAVGATRAVIALHEGRLSDAHDLIVDAPFASERWKLCQHYRAVCTLTPSSASR